MTIVAQIQAYLKRKKTKQAEIILNPAQAV
jgi:flagellar hook-length control protein FliK